VIGRPLAAAAFAVAAALAVLGAAGGCRRGTPAAPGAPNLLVIVADDLRWDGLGVTGAAAPRTPHIDELAKEGVLFANHFVSTSICACSRASIFTGQYVSRHGIRDFDQPFSKDALAATYPLLLRDHGYRVGFVGKWGIGGKTPDKDFDSFHGYADRKSYWHDEHGRRVHDTRLCVEQALDFLNSGDDRPFCLSVSFKAPHGPWNEPEPEFADAFADLTRPMPPVPAGDEALPEFLRETEGGARGGGRTQQQFDEMVRGYARLVAGLDAAVGEIRAALVAKGLDEKTVVVFTSDNGLFLGEHGLAGKWLMYEESIRVPLIVRDPSLAAASRGRREERMTLNVDLAPTLLDYGGVAAPAAMQGSSVRPLVRGESPTWRRDWFYEYHATEKLKGIVGVEGVRGERWSYARYDGVAPPYEQLFDLAADPHEDKNLAASPDAAKTLDEMRARWKELAAAAK
jgi:arylsulfatase A-like enzyme